MRRAIDWFASNSVAANILLIVIVAGGLLTIPRITMEIFPEISADMVTVTVPYPGAAPEEVEQALCVRVEEAVHGLDGIEKITSMAVEGACTVIIEARTGHNIRQLLDEVRSRVEGIDTFPEEAERPVIREVIVRNQVLNVAVAGDVDETTLKRLGERVRDEISALPGVTLAELAAVRPYEISIEVSEQALRRYNLTFSEVADAVRRSSVDLPGGSIETPGGEILLRTTGQAFRGEEFALLPLRTRPDGSRLLLGDVAAVRDTFAETDQEARFNGMPAALVQVFRVGDQSVLDVAAAVHEYVAQAQRRMPDGIQLTVWQDNSEYFRSRMNLLVKNGLTGLVLVLLVLALFMKLRVAFWVAVGIAASFLGALWMMPHLDVSINMLSMFAFILALGIVVDDAIVIGENVHTRQHRGEPGLRGAQRGANEVAVPVIFAVMTTVVAFAPLLFVPGFAGKIWRVIPLIVIPVLLFSLFESLAILPAHLAGGRRPVEASRRRGMLSWWPRFQGGFARGVDRTIHDLYSPALAVALRWRYLTVAVGVAILLIAVGMVAGGWIQLVFMPNVEADFVVATVTMALGTPVETTRAIAQRLEQAAFQVRDELDADRAAEEGSILRHMLTSIGEQPLRDQQRRGMGSLAVTESGAHLAEVIMELAPSDDRAIASEQVARRWRELTGPIPGAVEVTFTAALFSPGEPINIQLTGHQMDQLLRATEELKTELGRYSGVYDITDSYRAGKEELRLNIRPAAQHLGITLADLARQVRQAFFGEEAQRIQRGRDDVRVMVRYPREQRRSLGDVENMRIRTPEGAEVPFSLVAQVDHGRGFASIQRVDRRRAINVTADVDTARANATEIIDSVARTVLPRLVAEHPGLRWELEGEQREQQESLQSLQRGFLFAMLGIYALMAIPFKSYIQPLVVMTAVPFGLVGALLGHLLMGLDLSILSLSGMVALAGVVVNGSLVLTDYINRTRRRGVDVFEAVRQAGVARFRPVVLTALTTFAGLTPLLLETSLQAQFLIPMAVSLAFGVMFATLITLALVPCSYLILEDVGRLLARGLGRETPTVEEEREDAIHEPAA